MSHLRLGDERLHCSDQSHRWLSPNPDEVSDEVWRSQVEAHLEAHRSEGRGFDAVSRPGLSRRCG